MDDKRDPLPAKTEAKSPWQPLEDLRREVDRLFDDFGRSGWLQSLRSLNVDPALHRSFGWNSPAVDIVEKDTAFEITAELPGIAPKDVDVSMRNDRLVIRGEKQEEKEEKHKGQYLKERQYGAFERTLSLPDGVDTSAIEARFSNGVLTVTLPKTLEAQKPATKIEVKAT